MDRQTPPARGSERGAFPGENADLFHLFARGGNRVPAILTETDRQRLVDFFVADKGEKRRQDLVPVHLEPDADLLPLGVQEFTI